MAISCRISMEQSWQIRTLEQKYLHPSYNKQTILKTFRNTYNSKTRIILCRFWKTSLRWTILLELVQANNMLISCRTSIEQSWQIRTHEQKYLHPSYNKQTILKMFRNTYYSKTRIISCRFWKTSLRWTILLESVQAESMAISCRISMEQSWPIRTREQNLAAYVMPVSRWTHFLTVVKMPLKNNQKRKFVKWLNVESTFCDLTKKSKLR